MGKHKRKKERKAAWLLKGRTRRVVARILTEPMDSPGIAEAASRFVPKIERVQTSRILRQLSAKGVVTCLTPRIRPGRIFYLTRGGRRIVRAAFGAKTGPWAAPEGIDWYAYSRINKNGVMTAILIHMNASKRKGPEDVARMRHLLLSDRTITYEQIYRSLDYLASHGLVRYCGLSLRNDHRLYMITLEGERMAEQFGSKGL